MIWQMACTHGTEYEKTIRKISVLFPMCVTFYFCICKILEGVGVCWLLQLTCPLIITNKEIHIDNSGDNFPIIYRFINPPVSYLFHLQNAFFYSQLSEVLRDECYWS